MPPPSQSNPFLPPNHHFQINLAPLDALHPTYYSQRLYIFRCADSLQRDAQLSALKRGVRGLVERCPILGGVVVPLHRSDLGVVCAGGERTIVPGGRGLELVVRDLRRGGEAESESEAETETGKRGERVEVESFEAMEARRFDPCFFPYELFMPVPEDVGDYEEYAACKIQFSVIEGGCVLAFAMSHSVADGAGTDELIRILAKETRLAQVQAREYADGQEDGDSAAVEKGVVGFDRSVLRNIKSEIEFDIERHPAFRWELTTKPTTTAEQAPPPHPFEATAPETPILLHITAASLAQLKQDATTPNAPPISTHDALAALIWRSVLLIRSRRSPEAQNMAHSTTTTTTTNLFLPSDARRHLNLAPSYIGNAVYQLAASLPLSDLLSPSGLAAAASAVRRAITDVDAGLVASYMAVLRERWVDWEFMCSYSSTGVAMGTDWTSGSLYADDWGEAFGPLVSYRFPGGHAHSGCAVLPRLPNGDAEVVVGILPQEEGVLKGEECFGKYLKL